MSAPNATWGGTQAVKKEVSYVNTADQITEYVEVWTGNPLDGAWPTMAVGDIIAPNLGSVNLGNLAWYSVDTGQGQNKALAKLTAKAANKFHEVDSTDTKAKWHLDYGVEMVKLVGPNLWGVILTQPYVCPVVQRTILYVNTVPTVPADGIETPTPPFSVATPAQPPGVYYSGSIYPVWNWYKTSVVERNLDGYSLITRWQWMVTTGVQ